MPKSQQSFANHTKLVPLFHYVLVSLLIVNLVYRAVVLFRQFGIGPGVDLAVAIALGIMAWYVRLFALGAQDRVIRLEERLRCERLLPADLRARIPELSAGQMVALRFASDEELPQLARQVLEEGLRDRTAIKRRIRNWRADHCRI